MFQAINKSTSFRKNRSEFININNKPIVSYQQLSYLHIVLYEPLQTFVSKKKINHHFLMLRCKKYMKYKKIAELIQSHKIFPKFLYLTQLLISQLHLLIIWEPMPKLICLKTYHMVSY